MTFSEVHIDSTIMINTIHFFPISFYVNHSGSSSCYMILRLKFQEGKWLLIPRPKQNSGVRWEVFCSVLSHFILTLTFFLCLTYVLNWSAIKFLLPWVWNHHITRELGSHKWFLASFKAIEIKLYNTLPWYILFYAWTLLFF